ncbi:MAG: DUF2721 domain-containing protein [Desulfuromonadaceae bacterium]
MLKDVFLPEGMSRVIQLAIAPVFLLTAIGTLLGVMITRLHRTIDLAREWETKLESELQAYEVDHHKSHIAILSHRAKLIGRAITFCTAAALMICTLIAVLFIDQFVQLDITVLVAVLFILVMVSLIVGLLSFLREIYVATSNLRIGPH